MTIRLDAHLPEFHRGAPPQLPVRLAATGNVVIATGLNAGDTIDGKVLAAGDRVLLPVQSTGSQNGVYIAGVTPARSFDMSEGVAAWGAVIYVIDGTANGGKLFVNTNLTLPTIDTTALTFTSFTLASITAALVTVADAGGYFTGTNVEAVLQEFAAKVLGYQAHGNTGATETFDAATGWHSATLNAATVTFTLTGATSGLAASLFLELLQDGTGGRVISLPASVVNKAELEAAQVTTAGTTSLLVLLTRDGGTTWYGGWWGGSSAPTGAAGGDLSGTYPNPSVVDDSHSHTAATLPTNLGSDHVHVVDEQFNGDGATTVFPLAAEAAPDSVMAWVSGVRTPVTLGGSINDEITFGSAPASGTNNVSVDYAAVLT